ncbi:unnamed protein product, partial [Vitis vinifera]|uniref:R13L1/DRL21-like LRR repeat region domain-containing protein n=1 Tax=Vitis vinifera TaxID=29760 RepID=D7UBR5_VITVI
MGCLTNLQTLSKFIVGKGLHNVRNTRDAVDACLKNKCHIEELTMGWSGDFDDSRNELNEMLVLELLQPQRNLKKLTVEFYGGPKFPSWIGNPSFSKMESLTLKNCGKCTSLPCLGRLSLLKALRIQGMFEDMPEWEDWCFSDMVEECEGLFSCLRELRIRECPKLTGSLPNCLPSLAELEIFECPKLKAALPRLAYVCSLNVVECNEVVGCGEMTSLWENRFGLECLRGLESIDIWQCHGLESLEEQRLPCNLKHLKIENCANLQRLPNGLQSLTCLEELSLQSCPKLESFPEMGLPPMLRSLVLQKCNTLKLLPHNYNSGFLEYLEIEHCPCLISFPEDLYINNCENLKSLPHQMQNLLSLQELNIRNCQGLESFPECGLAPNLTSLSIRDCVNLKVPLSEWGLHRLTSLSSLYISAIGRCHWLVTLEEQMLPCKLKILKIQDCANLEELPNGLQSLISLQELKLERCPKLISFPEAALSPLLRSLVLQNCPSLICFPNGELPTTLKHMRVEDCENLESLPEGMMHHKSSSTVSKNTCCLEKLWIKNCSSLKFFPTGELPSTLELLCIWGCANLESISEKISLELPATLGRLEITGCPIIKESCLKEKGGYWPNFSHIPCIQIDGSYIH